MYNGLPEVKVYDDIGMLQVDCYLDESEVVCLVALHTEACRMGGDIVYNLPKKALRPIERGMVYRAQVAHTRETKKPTTQRCLLRRTRARSHRTAAAGRRDVTRR